MCSLGYEAIDCYKTCDRQAAGAGARQKKLLETLLQATREDSREAFVTRMQVAAKLSAEWNGRELPIRAAMNACHWETASAFVLKLRANPGNSAVLLTLEQSQPIYFAVLFRNPAQRVVSNLRMHAGAGQFARSKALAAAPVTVQYSKLRREVYQYLNSMRQTNELLYQLEASFLTVSYTDICEQPRKVLAAALSFMGVSAPTAQVAVASRFQQSAPPSLRAKVSNLDEVCAAARADTASGIYRWLEKECA